MKLVPRASPPSYRVDRLVWFQAHQTREAALAAGEADQGMEARVEDPS